MMYFCMYLHVQIGTAIHWGALLRRCMPCLFWLALKASLGSVKKMAHHTGPCMTDHSRHLFSVCKDIFITDSFFSELSNLQTVPIAASPHTNFQDNVNSASFLFQSWWVNMTDKNVLIHLYTIWTSETNAFLFSTACTFMNQMLKQFKQPKFCLIVLGGVGQKNQNYFQSLTIAQTWSIQRSQDRIFFAAELQAVLPWNLPLLW